jgi:hypothetical protein
VPGRAGQEVALHVDDQKCVRGAERAEPKGHT